MSGVPPVRPLSDSLAAALGAALSVGSIVAAVDIARVIGGGEVGATTLLVLSLYALPCLLLGSGLGVLAWGWRTTLGERCLRRIYRRLATEREFDKRVCAGVLAAVLTAAGYAVSLVLLARVFVIGVQRQEVGALLVGTGAVVLLPAFAAAGIVAYRATRRLAVAVPRLGPIPATLVLVLGGAALASAAMILVAVSRLDWRALDLAFYATVLCYCAGLLAWIALWYGPAAKLRQRIPRRGFLVAAGCVVAAALAGFGLGQEPPQAAITSVSEDTSGARVLLAAARSLSDGDGDGYSALLGGPDCDDHNPSVHPGAQEIAGNGIDDNCLGGDRAPRATPIAAADTATPTTTLSFDGNLLFILVDTTRGDRLGAAGYRPDGHSYTPNLDRLAAKSAYFTRAYAQAPNTARSIPSIMTSLYPSQIAVDAPTRNFPKTLESNLMLFEVLAERGMTTAGFASHYYFEVNPGIRQGFASFDNHGAKPMERDGDEIAAPRIVPRAIEAIEQFASSGQRFAVFVHLFEPHSSYMRHDGIAVRSGRMTDRYDGELQAADAWVGRLLSGLEDVGMTDKTTVVVTSDHGEGFGEHSLAGRRMYYHGRTLYQELLHVPLIIHVPGKAAAQRIDTPVAMVDLMPTLLELFGAPRTTELAGRSLMPALLGQALKPRPIFSELLPASYWKHAAKSMISADGDHKLIQYLMPNRRTELFDLANDAGEKKNLSRAQPERAAAMRERIIEWIELDLQSR